MPRVVSVPHARRPAAVPLFPGSASTRSGTAPRAGNSDAAAAHPTRRLQMDRQFLPSYREAFRDFRPGGSTVPQAPRRKAPTHEHIHAEDLERHARHPTFADAAAAAGPAASSSASPLHREGAPRSAAEARTASTARRTRRAESARAAHRATARHRADVAHKEELERLRRELVERYEAQLDAQRTRWKVLARRQIDEHAREREQIERTSRVRHDAVLLEFTEQLEASLRDRHAEELEQVRHRRRVEQQQARRDVAREQELDAAAALPGGSGESNDKGSGGGVAGGGRGGGRAAGGAPAPRPNWAQRMADSPALLSARAASLPHRPPIQIGRNASSRWPAPASQNR